MQIYLVLGLDPGKMKLNACSIITCYTTPQGFLGYFTMQSVSPLK
jgi:hypothetical protein